MYTSDIVLAGGTILMLVLTTTFSIMTCNIAHRINVSILLIDCYVTTIHRNKCSFEVAVYTARNCVI